MKVKLPIIGQSYTMPSVNIDVQNCINWYPVFDATGKSPISLLPTEGLTLFSDDSSNKSVRGLHKINDRLFAVVDDTLYDVLSNGERKSLGTLATSSGRLKIDSNESQVSIFDGDHGYVYQLVKNETRKVGDFYQILEASSQIGDPTFVGQGLDDMDTSGTYINTVDKIYVAQIDSVGATDTFKWSDDNGVTFTGTGVAITGTAQTLNDGVEVTFVNTTGHTLENKWTFSVIIDSSFYAPIMPTTQDGYGIYPRKNSNIFSLSSINDYSLVNALDFAKVEGKPDNIVASISSREEVWFICTTSSEVWYDSGLSDFPFQRRENILFKYGCAAAFSILELPNNSLVWLASNDCGGNQIVTTVGYEIVSISSEPINYAIDNLDRVDDAFAYCYQRNEHLFYVITFPTANKTFVYDFTVKRWHERKSTISNSDPLFCDTIQGRWRPNCYAYFAGKHIVGDFESGKLYELDPDNNTENGVRIERETTGHHTVNKLDRFFINSLEMDIEAGVGLTSGQGSDPQIMLQMSKDSGHTFNTELWRSIGGVGEYKKRVIWNRLGRARVITYKIRSTDPIKCVILGAFADLEAQNG